MGKTQKEIGTYSRSNKTKDNLYVGYMSCGWRLIKMYEHYNLWERNKIRECFYKDEVPNRNAVYEIN